MKGIFNKKLYKESMRQMMAGAIVSCVVILFLTIIHYLSLTGDDSISYDFSYNAIYPLFLSLRMFAIMAIFVFFILGTTLFYVHDRCKSDFYDALPFTRKTMLFTNIIAALTYVMIIFLMVVLVGTGLTLGYLPGRVLIWDDYFKYILVLFSSIFLVISITVLATSLNGKGSTTFITAILIAFMPRGIISTIIYSTSSSDLLENLNPLLNNRINVIFSIISQVTSIETGETSSFNMWYTVIYSVILGTVYLLLGYYFFKRRKSEWAGDGYTNRAVYFFNRVGIGVCVSLASIMLLFTREYRAYIIFMLVALLTIFLYDIIISRKLGYIKDLVKAFILFLISHVALIAVYFCVDNYLCDYKFDYKKISGFMVSEYYNSGMDSPILYKPNEEVQKILADVLNHNLNDKSYDSHSDEYDQISVKYNGYFLNVNIDSNDKSYDKLMELIQDEKAICEINLPKPTNNILCRAWKQNWEYDETYKQYYKELVSLSNEDRIKMFNSMNKMTISISYYKNQSIHYIDLPFSYEYMPEFTRFFIEQNRILNASRYEDGIKYLKENTKKKVVVYSEREFLGYSTDNSVIIDALEANPAEATGYIYRVWINDKIGSLYFITDKEITLESPKSNQMKNQTENTSE